VLDYEEQEDAHIAVDVEEYSDNVLGLLEFGFPITLIKLSEAEKASPLGEMIMHQERAWLLERLVSRYAYS
jgi:hypothetical protein